MLFDQLNLCLIFGAHQSRHSEVNQHSTLCKCHAVRSYLDTPSGVFPMLVTAATAAESSFLCGEFCYDRCMSPAGTRFLRMGAIFVLCLLAAGGLFRWVILDQTVV